MRNVASWCQQVTERYIGSPPSAEVPADLDQAIDTSTPAGKTLLQMLAVVAEFETAIRPERQMDGIAKAKAKGNDRPADHEGDEAQQGFNLSRAWLTRID